MLERLRRWIPTRCLLCQRLTEKATCAACALALPWREGRCHRCGQALYGRRLCEHCLVEPPIFDCLCVLFDYTLPIDRWIWRLKYQRQLHYAHAFSRWLGEVDWPRPQLLIPVPLHPKRWRKRGFNQAEEIAREVGKALCLPVLTQGVQRVKDTPAQSASNKADRASNMRGAFEVTANIRYRHVAIIDDVFTTGATVGALARVLKAQGVERVDVWCVAQR